MRCPEHRESDGNWAYRAGQTPSGSHGRISRIDLEGRVTFVAAVTDDIGLATAERINASGGQAVLRDADSSAIKSAPAKFDFKFTLNNLIRRSRSRIGGPVSAR